MSKWYEVTLTIYKCVAVEVPDKTDNADDYVIPENEEQSKKQAAEYAAQELSAENYDWEIMELDSEPSRGMQGEKFSL